MRRGIETFGGTGDSLVKGVGGSARKIVITCGMIAHGEGVNPLELHGAVDSLEITEGFAAIGGGFEII